MWTRTIKPLEDKLPHLEHQFSQMRGDYLLDGELGYVIRNRHEMPIIDFNATMRVIGSGPDEAQRKQFENYGTLGSIEFFAFDLLWSSEEGNGAGQEQRERERRLWKHADDLLVPDVNIVHTYDHWDEKTYVDYVEAGGEGVILKNPFAEYKPGKRPANNWYKVKKYETMDVVVTGYTAGKGKYEDMIGAIEFEVGGKTVRCSGMDDQTRYEITLAPGHYLHRVMEIRYFGKVGQDGEGLRFPQFLRWRPDKDATTL
jgi:ATP-dependent DNA ligase